MCLIVFDWRPDVQRGPLFTLAANRDEFLRRTAAPLQWWDDAPDVLAGRDLVGGGTWLGVSRDGRFAALTNYRAPHEMRADAPTRGTLVSDWLTRARDATHDGFDTPLAYLHDVATRGDAYNGFNLLIGDFRRRELAWYSNRASMPPALLAAGTHGISNAVLDTPWPKLVAKRAELAGLAGRTARTTNDNPHVPPLADLIAMMRDPHVAPDDALPSTGIPLARERALSAAFIDTPDYGTRGTTALRVDATSKADAKDTLAIDIVERSDDDGSHRLERPGHFERRYTFEVVA